jgi:hypothetical protein
LVAATRIVSFASGVHILNEAVYHTLQFPEFLLVVAQLGDGIEHRP